MDRRSTGIAARERGAAAVEFALLLPVLLLLVFGIVDFGRALNAQITLTQAAREGVRLAALGQPNVVSRTQAAATGISPVTATVTVCRDGARAAGEGVGLAALARPSVGARPQPAATGISPVTVTVTVCRPGAGPAADAVV